MKSELKTEPCIAIASKLQLLDCALQDTQRQVENRDAERRRLQVELTEARQQAEADAETARMAREILLCEIRSVKEERDHLQSRVTLLEGQRKPGILGRLLKGRLL